LKNTYFGGNAYFELAADIDLYWENWSPIPDFTGTLDGKGFKILNLNLYANTYMGVHGLYAENHGVLENFEIRGWVVVQDSVSVGFVTGSNYGTIRNVHAKGERAPIYARRSPRDARKSQSGRG